MKAYLVAAAALALGAPATAVSAASTTDAAGDFLATYTGPQGADLDILSTGASQQGNGFLRFETTAAGTIGSTTGAFYVFGVDRGAGTSRFPSVAPGVLFDAVVVINNNGTGFTRDLIAGVTTNLAPSAIRYDGSSLSALVDIALLPSLGFAVDDYTFNLWSRIGGAGNAPLADFAPDNSNLAIGAVPEPASWAMMIAGFGLAGSTMRRRRAAPALAA